MKQFVLLSLLLLLSMRSYGQFTMRAEGVKVENACRGNYVHFLISGKARPKESMETIEKRLNETVFFAKENPALQATPAIQFVVNCKGEVGGGFHVVTRSGNAALDEQLIEFFKTVHAWEAGKLKKKTVDSWYMWRLQIANGRFDILNQ
jgi:hypothetical protein